MRLVKTLAALVALAIAAAVALGYFLYRPFAGFQGEAFVEVPKGAAQGVQLRSGDEISLGAVRLRFEAEEDGHE